MHNFGYFEEGSVGKVSDVRIWQRILGYCRPHKLGIFFSILLSLLITCATLALPRLMQLGIDRYIAAGDQETAVRFVGLTRLAFIYGELCLSLLPPDLSRWYYWSISASRSCIACVMICISISSGLILLFLSASCWAACDAVDQ